MNKLTDYILEPGNQLYRYDNVQPPKEWSTVFKNPEYVYPDTGVKNQIGAFFFFNSIFFAIETGRCALEKERKRVIHTKDFGLQNVKLIHLSSYWI